MKDSMAVVSIDLVGRADVDLIEQLVARVAELQGVAPGMHHTSVTRDDEHISYQVPATLGFRIVSEARAFFTERGYTEKDFTISERVPDSTDLHEALSKIGSARNATGCPYYFLLIPHSAETSTRSVLNYADPETARQIGLLLAKRLTSSADPLEAVRPDIVKMVGELSIELVVIDSRTQDAVYQELIEDVVGGVNHDDQD